MDIENQATLPNSTTKPSDTDLICSENFLGPFTSTINKQTVRILLIDDDGEFWKQTISEIVNEVMCEFTVVPLDNIDFVQKEDLSKFDVVIQNIYHKHKEGPIGLSYIEAIHNRYNKMPIIVLTSLPVADGMKNYYDKLHGKNRIKYYSTKDNIRYDHFRSWFYELVGLSGLVDKNHIEEENPLRANKFPVWEQYKWSSKDKKNAIPSGVIREIIEGLEEKLPDNDFMARYWDEICQISFGDADWKLSLAVQIWIDLWIAEPGLPHQPLIKLLAIQETQGVKYPGYRDHVIHSFWTYLLGLYLYKACKPIHNAISLKLTSHQFLRSWKIASFFHDIGNICDVGIDNEEQKYESDLKPILDDITNFIRFPLRTYLEMRGKSLGRGEEEELAQACSLYRPVIENLDQLERRPDKPAGGWILEEIERLIIPTKLAINGVRTPLKNYNELTKNEKPKHRNRFRDHGILSAMILLYEFYHFDNYIKKLRGTDFPGSLNDDIPDLIREIISNSNSGLSITEEYSLAVHEAASAIALHDINVNNWYPYQSKKYQLNFSNYRIDLSENPLAFLLALVDVLQCWSRRRYLFSDEQGDLSLPSQDVHIRCSGDLIFWSVDQRNQIKSSTTSTKKQYEKLKQSIQDMSDYMNIPGLDDLSTFLIEKPFSEDNPDRLIVLGP